jgi:hypothetical protein
VAGSTDVAQTIERRLREIEAQLRSYEELARERDRLQRALRELVIDDGERPGRASAKTSAAGRASAGRRRGARRARRGSNVEAITGFVTANPGATAAEIAIGTGIRRGVVYSATSRLAGSGRLRRVAQGDRQVGYELGVDEAGGAAAPEPFEAAGPAPRAVASRATGGPSAGGEIPRVPVGAARPAAKRARTATPTVAPNSRGEAKRPATGARPPAGGQPGAKRGGRAATGRRSAAARGRAPRGANRAAVLAVIGERPGVSARELAASSGVGGGTLYALLRTLTQGGEISKQRLPSGHTGYTAATAATTAAPPPVPHAPHAVPTDSARTPAPAAGRGEHNSTATPTASDDLTAADARAGEQSPEDAADSK